MSETFDRIKAAMAALRGEGTGLEAMAKGNLGLPPPTGAIPTQQQHDLDPWHIAAGMHHEELGGDAHHGTLGLSYDTLRIMARVPVISAVIDTRVRQVCEFALPQTNDYNLGFSVKTKAGGTMSKAQQRRACELTDWLMTCGDPRVSDWTFPDMIHGITRDSLIFDQACWEKVRTRGGKLAALVPVDAGTIRRAKLSEKEKDQGRREPFQDKAYVQLIDHRVTARWPYEDFVFGIRRRRTWIYASGYGYPELEELVKTITYLINAEAYNAANFTNGMHVAGILAIKSKMNPKLFRAFRREFYAMLSGASNAKKTPIIQLDPDAKEELQSVAMSQSNREMEYEKWIGWLLRITCAIYGMDPAELGFIYGAEGQTNSLVQQGPAEKVSASKERGLRPLLRKLESWINRYVFADLDPDYVFAFEGFDEKNEKVALDADVQATKSFRTINETRARRGMDPLDSKVGDMILDPSYISTAWQMAAQEEQGGDEDPMDGFDMDQFGGENEEPDEDVDLDAMFGGDDKPAAESTSKSQVRTVTVEVV